MKVNWNWGSFFSFVAANGFFWTAVGTVVAVAGFCLASVLVIYWPWFAEWTKTITLHDILVNVGFYYLTYAVMIGCFIASHYDTYEKKEIFG
jgi:hypothetical protein